MADYVLDPAVACKWFLPSAQERYVVEARMLLDRIANGADTAHVPALFAYEFGAWAHDVGPRFNLDAERTFEAVSALPLVEHPLDRDLSAAAHLGASRLELDFYTAVYVALSEKLIVPFVTSDDDLVARLSGKTRIAGLK